MSPPAPLPAGSAPTISADLVDGLVELSFTVQGMLSRLAAAQDLSLVQARLLGVLRGRQPEMRDLARYLGLDKSSITGLVDRAERRGLVARTRAPRDGRAIQVTLTEEGRRLVDACAAQVERDLGVVLEPLPERDRARLTSLIGRVLAQQRSAAGHNPDAVLV